MINSHRAFDFEREGATLIVMLKSDSLSTEESALEREINALHKELDKPDILNLVVDIGPEPFFGSIVIGAVMALCHKAVSGGGKAILCNASDSMRDVIRIMKLDTVMPYCDSREEAMQSLEK